MKHYVYLEDEQVHDFKLLYDRWIPTSFIHIGSINDLEKSSFTEQDEIVVYIQEKVQFDRLLFTLDKIATDSDIVWVVDNTELYGYLEEVGQIVYQVSDWMQDLIDNGDYDNIQKPSQQKVATNEPKVKLETNFKQPKPTQQQSVNSTQSVEQYVQGQTPFKKEQKREIVQSDYTPVAEQQNAGEVNGKGKQSNEPTSNEQAHFIEDELIVLNHLKVNYEEDQIHIKKREIQKKLFSNRQWADHKIVGVWSPTGKSGASLTAINLALAMSEQRTYTTVLEGLTENPALKLHLNRYAPIHEDWTSYASCIQEEKDPRNASWMYENVVFLPTTQSDLAYKWNPQLIEAYMTTPKIADITLVDFPSGKFENFTLDALPYLDELWVMYDDNFHDLIKWRDTFKWLKETYSLPIYAVMGRSYSFSQPEKIAEEIGLPFLASIPALDEQVMQHYYGHLPLWKIESVRDELLESYNLLYEHLLKKPLNVKKGEHTKVPITQQVLRLFKQLQSKHE